MQSLGRGGVRPRIALFVVGALFLSCRRQADAPAPASKNKDPKAEQSPAPPRPEKDSVPPRSDSASKSPAQRAREYQQQREAKYRSDAQSPFAAVASHYLQRGNEATLDLGHRPLRFVLGSLKRRKVPVPGPHFEFKKELRCSAGCPRDTAIKGQQKSFRFGPITVVVSPQSGAARLLVYDQSALMAGNFEALKWFPINEEMMVTATYRSYDQPQAVSLVTTRGLNKQAWEVGTLGVPWKKEAIPLRVYTFSPPGAASKPSSGLSPDNVEVLVPFKDQTTRKSTYGSGRYLKLEVPVKGGPVLVDFNRAYNPACAYSSHFNCPMPPRKNRLPFAVQAGEKNYKVKKSPEPR